jgi:hypothetical protein
MDSTYELITNYLDEKQLEPKDVFVEQYMKDPITAGRRLGDRGLRPAQVISEAYPGRARRTAPGRLECGHLRLIRLRRRFTEQARCAIKVPVADGHGEGL